MASVPAERLQPAAASKTQGEDQDAGSSSNSRHTAELKTLSVGGLRLSPAFAPGVRHYEAEVCFGDGTPEALAISAEAEDEIALIGLTAPGHQTMATGRVSAKILPWSPGMRPHPPARLIVTVSSPDGQRSLSYVATLKERCTKARLDDLVVRGPAGSVCDLEPAFEPRITTYDCVLRGSPANLTVLPRLRQEFCPSCKLQLPDPRSHNLEAASMVQWNAGQPWTVGLDSTERFTLPLTVSGSQMLSATYQIHFRSAVLTSTDKPSTSGMSLRHASSHPLSPNLTHAMSSHVSGPQEFLARAGWGAVDAVESGLHTLLIVVLIMLIGAVPIALIKVRGTTSRAASYTRVELADPRSDKSWVRQMHLAYKECIPHRAERDGQRPTMPTWKVLGPFGLAGRPLWCVVGLALVCALAALLVGIALASSFPHADANSPFVNWLLAFTGIGGFAALVTMSLASGCHLLAHLDGPEGAQMGKGILFETAAIPLEGRSPRPAEVLPAWDAQHKSGLEANVTAHGWELEANAVDVPELEATEVMDAQSSH